MPDNADTQDAFGIRIDDEFRQTIRSVEAQRAPRSSPREFGNLHFDSLLLRLGFGQTTPGHLGISEHDSGNHKLVATSGFAGDDLDGDPRLARGLVREQHAARAVADGVDGGLAGLLLLVGFDEAFVVTRDLRVLQAEIVAVWHATYGDQHAVVQFLFLLTVGFDNDFDLFALGLHLGDLGFQPHFLERLLSVSHHGTDQVGVGAEQDGIQGFDNDHLAAERGIDGAQLHANVAAAHDQKVGGNLFHFERLARGHHAWVAEIKRFRHG